MSAVLGRSVDVNREKLLKKLYSMLNKFNLQELQTIIVPHFTNLSWNNIKNEVVHKKLTLNSKSVIKVIHNSIKEDNVNNDEIQKMILFLELQDTSRHSTKKTWYTFVMKHRNRESAISQSCSKNDLILSLTRCLRKHNYKASIDIVIHDSLYFLMLVESPRITRKTRQFIISHPIIFALKLDHNCFFCIKKTGISKIKDVLTEALGYQSYKNIPLKGKHLLTMCQLLQNKKNGFALGSSTDMQQNQLPVINDHGTDFTQYKHRKKYLESRMGCENLQLESVSFSCTNAIRIPPNWSSKRKIGVQNLTKKKINLRWEMRSKNVFKMIPFLAENRQLKYPPPQYIIDWMKLGKNIIAYKQED